MKALYLLISTVLMIQIQASAQDGEWESLFNGKNLDGWTVSENQSAVWVEDGMIVTNGERAHAFYSGSVGDHDFTNFELKVMVKTEKNANAGIYFHTAFQDEGWPSKGYEVQVNNSHTDWRRSGSLYAISDVKENYVKDGEWYSTYIKVEGKHVLVKLNDIVVVDYTEPEMPLRDEGSQRLIDSGTFALQAHDPGSKVYFKEIMVRQL